MGLIGEPRTDCGRPHPVAEAFQRSPQSLPPPQVHQGNTDLLSYQVAQAWSGQPHSRRQFRDRINGRQRDERWPRVRRSRGECGYDVEATSGRGG
jgi:hypothetical protein